MIRLFGLALIAVATFGFGALYADLLQKEIRRWEGFLSLGETVRSRICSFRQPLSEIYRDFSDEALDACGFTARLRESGFPAALCACREALGLRPPLVALLSDFGERLGKSYTEDQLRLCDRFLTEGGQWLTRLKADQPGKARLARTVSAAIAALSFILLL